MMHTLTLPENKPVSLRVLRETADERVELQEYRYPRVKVAQRQTADGTWTTVARDLDDVRLNPWWYPHDSLYTPANDGTGFTGWIGGVAVFSRALSVEEMRRLSGIASGKPVSAGSKP